MAARVPSIACIGVIGKLNNPLHISLFPASSRSPLEFTFLLSSSLDIFAARLPSKTVEQDFGLLQAVDERLAMYGWLTNTGIKIVIIVDMEGKPAGVGAESRNSAALGLGLKDADLKPAFRALQTAYVGLLRNPFYDPEAHSPAAAEGNVGSTQITSRRFIDEVKRVGETWAPGMTTL
ncbi:Sedlin [Saccharata proteae CBS 121410]|uniref:Sedlin n=1 Tax=Saccharata proteae CBS 121410 TaxID=1314787 RepID=A0A9P4HVA5_9PEZI|nr:Sedlin [Saccharata proteae CBS 121410]